MLISLAASWGLFSTWPQPSHATPTYSLWTQANGSCSLLYTSRCRHSKDRLCVRNIAALHVMGKICTKNVKHHRHPMHICLTFDWLQVFLLYRWFICQDCYIEAHDIYAFRCFLSVCLPSGNQTHNLRTANTIWTDLLKHVLAGKVVVVDRTRYSSCCCVLNGKADDELYKYHPHRLE